MNSTKISYSHSCKASFLYFVKNRYIHSKQPIPVWLSITFSIPDFRCNTLFYSYIAKNGQLACKFLNACNRIAHTGIIQISLDIYKETILPLSVFDRAGFDLSSGLSHYNKSLQAYYTMLQPDVSLQNKDLTCSHLTDTPFDS